MKNQIHITLAQSENGQIIGEHVQARPQTLAVMRPSSMLLYHALQTGIHHQAKGTSLE
jgi:hypothetical protein